MITEEMLLKHNMIPISQFRHSERDWYETFLIQTDYIANKIIEAQALGDDISEYKDILLARKFARQQINAIDEGTYSGEAAGTNIPIIIGDDPTEEELRDIGFII